MMDGKIVIDTLMLVCFTNAIPDVGKERGGKMFTEAHASNFVSNFQLKNCSVDLLPSSRSDRAELSLSQLEAMRTASPSIPASKHGLEAICGASCETGAQ